MPDIDDYLIEQAGKNWAELLSSWVPPLPKSFTIWLVNRVGDVFVVLDDGSVHMLDVGVGTLTRLAEDRDDFCTKIDLDDNANNWLLMSLVDSCVSAGMVLAENQCYGYVMPPIFNGKYTVENLIPTDLSVHYSFLAAIYRQAQALPDGTKARVVVKNLPERRRM
jgi:Domain of unknown function (DUF1851)